MCFRHFVGQYQYFIVTILRLCLMIVIIDALRYYHKFANIKLHYDTDVLCLPVEPDVSFNATSSDIDVGQTELEQYYRYTKITEKRKDIATYSKYSYKIAIIENRSTIDGVVIRIEEYLNKRSTNGGSSFIITADHIGTEQCPYRDLFNGTYLAWCPPMTVRERRTIVVTLEYVNFAADLRLDKGNWNPKVKIDAPVPLRSTSVAEALKTYARKEDVVLWYKNSDRWKVKLANGEHFWSLSTKGMCDCIKKIRRVIMMGSSHMRYKLKQLLAKHDFEVFDEFSILRPVAERDLCTGHYICPMFNGKAFDVYGDVGFTSVRLMISHVCKGNTRWFSPSCE
ncbi:hypothetical protein LSAT2_026894 [Lamellibrachia satsuma]|nr:hypothetical protein LSAT2_026894 [Lamellibrachia satsuma]